jgi:hypothetical protein
MARKDLAGIAALAGLGMLMANRGKKGSKADEGARKRQISEDREANETQSGEGDSDMDPMEAANKRTERTLMPNQRGAAGTSETMYPSAKPSGGGGGGAAPAAPAVKPAAMPVPSMRDSEAGMSRGTRNVPPAVSIAGAGRGGQGGPRAGEAEAYRQKQYAAAQAAAATPEGKAARQKQAESQAVEGVYPESNFIAPGLKAAQSAIKGIASRFGGDSAKAASPFLKELPYGGAKQLPNAPTKQLTGPSKADLMARDRAARATGRNEEMARENARRYGLNPDDMSATTSSLLRKNMGGDDFSLPLKKGGMAKRYASGGSVSSASSRGDGIASKGKTRGKIY